MTGETERRSENWMVRREGRKPTNWIAVIRLYDGREIATTVKDASASAARSGVQEGLSLPERFMFKVLGREYVCAVRTMWRRRSNVGAQIEQVGKLLTSSASAELSVSQVQSSRTALGTNHNRLSPF